MRPVVLQVPEVCAWNTYVALAEDHLRRLGCDVVRPGVCSDEPGAGRPSADTGIVPHIVHLHWPDKLAAQHGADKALALLEELVDAGSHIVQTVHNVRPHDSRGASDEFIDEIDALTAGAHFFSRSHELVARRSRTRLPETVLHLAHPRYPGLSRAPQSVERRAVERTIGCFGRLRGYKRVDRFARAFRDTPGDHLRLVVAGVPETPDLSAVLDEVARDDPRITFFPGFHGEGQFADLIRSVDCVALPYGGAVYSSGVLISALQLGTPVICPPVVGGAECGVDSNTTVIDPWDDRTAVARFACAPVRAATPTLRLPTWHVAAKQLLAFYEQVRCTP